MSDTAVALIFAVLCLSAYLLFMIEWRLAKIARILEAYWRRDHS